MENNKDTEIEKILGEMPLESTKPKKVEINTERMLNEQKEKEPTKLQTYKPKRFNFNKKKIFIGLGIIITLFVLYLILVPQPVVCEYDLAQEEAVNKFAEEIRQSVINNGYVSINIDGQSLKLAPYTG